MPGDRRTVRVPPGDRAISDALGFVLVFAIIVSTVAVVYIGGFNSLDNARQFERMNNAERAFEVLAANVEDMTHRGAPSRATEVKLAEATLVPGDDVEIEVRVERSSDPDVNTTATYTAQPIVYRSEEAGANNVYYSQGAVLRQSGESSIISRRPGIVVGSDHVMIPIVQTRGGDATPTSGSSTVLIRTERSTSSVVVGNHSAKYDVYFNMTTPRADAWRLYLQDREGATCPAADNTDTFVTCHWTGIERVYVTRIAIDFTFE